MVGNGKGMVDQCLQQQCPCPERDCAATVNIQMTAVDIAVQCNYCNHNGAKGKGYRHSKAEEPSVAQDVIDMPQIQRGCGYVAGQKDNGVGVGKPRGQNKAKID